MGYRERIEADPDIMLGKPIVKGTRITVELLLTKLGDGASTEDLLLAYPHLKREDIMAALAYSADVVGREELLVS
ncbi:DUF433 domain-containing protein [Trichlorobacter sp.]|jgi:uncharacterized protein (DUF433 family)|uniref:DUF433 domain-containing protein n=1 Tax=Trichlorobacter sp. TaxID=2911007 RepID=UPI002A367542|nr:DUF433 domain-containing protein [Trichlorobacter sp.]MDY0383208.1 DUF433 domain-containing protein [Trichlorobacter sp.]